MASYNSGAVKAKDHRGSVQRDLAGANAGVSLSAFSEVQRGELMQCVLHAFRSMELEKYGALESNLTVAASITGGTSFSLTIS
jgi:hypothetical protein